MKDNSKKILKSSTYLVLLVGINGLLLETTNYMSELYSINTIEPPWNIAPCDGHCVGNAFELMVVDWGVNPSSRFYFGTTTLYSIVVVLLISLLWFMIFRKDNKESNSPFWRVILIGFVLQLIGMLWLYLPHIIMKALSY
jgi:hypothetical protein